MTDRTTELRRLTADLKNPIRDKRVKVGFQAHDVFPAGTTFLYSPSVAPEGRPAHHGRLPATIDVFRPKADCMDQDIVAAWVEASEPCEPTTWKELEGSILGTIAYGFATDVLDRLVKNGGPLVVHLLRQELKAAFDETEEG